VKKLIFAFIVMLIFPFAISAQNTPCSGKKGGISHCNGEKFVCNDGSYSKSKRICSGQEKKDDANATSDNSDAAATNNDIPKKKRN
jgi:hypothetical protein